MQEMVEKSFLGEVARSLYRRYGEDFASLALLFPSRRARLFFADELARIAEHPLWEPLWLAPDQLMEELSGLRVGDRLRLVVELYRIYSRYHHESFDAFYFWGDRLLSDFDMVDKYRVDARMLFCNIAEIKELEADLSYLSPEQREVINRFWQGVLEESEDTPERRRFLTIWNSLGSIYHEYRERLRELGFAYSGMVQRQAADRIRAGEAALSADRHYVVAGFNALSECEKILFDHLKSLGADFFWDYDDYYLRSEVQEAGMFLRENCRRYPEPPGEITHDFSKWDKQLRVVSSVSDAVQCKAISSILEEFRSRDPETGKLLPLDKRTAIVLTDEGLLMPLLSSMQPSEQQSIADAVNVTMGFPLKQTAAYTFVERLLELQSHRRQKGDEALFYHADVLGLLSHPCLETASKENLQAFRKEIVDGRYIRVPASLFASSPLLASIFVSATDWRELSDWLQRALGTVGAGVAEEGDMDPGQTAALLLLSEEVNKLRNSVELCDIELSTSIYMSLLRKHLQTLRVPFEGEPLNGIQVMGILETRNLDFDQVVILSMTDDNFPGRLDAGASYIPYNLRAAYGLPTPEHHEGVYSYYFYRLIQRARSVVMCYCSRADEKTTGEPSRYIRQLEYESGRRMSFTELGVDVNLPEEEPIEVAKSGRVREALERYLVAENPLTISPTAFARYLACPLKFYFASIAHLKEQEEIADEVDNPLFGNLLHGSMERLYAPLLHQTATPSRILKMIRSDEVEQAVKATIEAELFRGEPTPESEYGGQLLLVRDIVVRYIREAILNYDMRHPHFRVEGLETGVACDFAFDAGRRVRFAGKADRLDLLQEGSYRVVDYKTGGVHLEFGGLDDLFVTKNRSLNGNIFQTLLYSLMLWHDRATDALPALYYVRRMNSEEYSPYLVDKSLGNSSLSYSTSREGFEQRLRERLLELFDFATPFRPCEDVETCRFCDFKSICRRG